MNNDREYKEYLRDINSDYDDYLIELFYESNSQKEIDRFKIEHQDNQAQVSFQTKNFIRSQL